MNRENYRAMFSLDDDSLEAGGEEILRSEGNLGQLLFATGAGLVELSETLNRLRDGARGFYRPKSRSTELHTLKTQLEQLEREKKSLDTAASAHARLVAERDAASNAYDEAIALRAKLEADREEAVRRKDGLRHLAQIHSIRAELANLQELPEAPQLWFTQVPDLIADEPRFTERVKGLRDQRRNLREEQETLVLDEAILKLKDRLASLDKGRARYVTAERRPTEAPYEPRRTPGHYRRHRPAFEQARRNRSSNPRHCRRYGGSAERTDRTAVRNRRTAEGIRRRTRNREVRGRDCD